ncbi:hypothetical protein GF354_01360 [Candidatus Peregrinibacteria bacterium]|nr:hypothetical protein [Candidatus Peregrinibacteria bacterium]
MSNSSFNQGLKNLNSMEKVIGLGSFLLIISSLLPWYQDIDKFKTGDMFLGITGPLYLAGFIVLGAGAISFLIILAKALQRPVDALPVRPSLVFIFGSSIALLMQLLAASVYFHDKFGINIMEKTAGVGLIIAFFAALMILGGGISQMKKIENRSATKEHMDSMIDMGLEERPAKSVKKDLPKNKGVTINLRDKEPASSDPQVREPVNVDSQPDRPQFNDDNRPKNAYKGAGGFRTPYQQSIPDSYFSKDAFNKTE